MKKNRISVMINQPIAVVFAYTVNPEKTPEWIDNIQYEEANERPPQVGTIYRNQLKDGSWSEYQVDNLKQNAIFELRSIVSDYHVRYAYKEVGERETELEYFEWVDSGSLTEPFTQEVLEKLKENLERK